MAAKIVALTLTSAQKAELIAQLISQTSQQDFVAIARRVLRETKRRSYTMGNVRGWKSLQQEYDRFGAEMREQLQASKNRNVKNAL